MENYYALIAALRAVIGAMQIVLVIRVLFELMVLPRDSRPFRFIIYISEPLLNPVRKLLSAQTKAKNLKFDVSPLVVIILLYLINILLKRYII
jgi:uncharacterized protein YggT (Ycf19 family)